MQWSIEMIPALIPSVRPFFYRNYYGDWIWLAVMNWWLVNHTTHKYVVCPEGFIVNIVTFMPSDRASIFRFTTIPTHPYCFHSHLCFLPSSWGLLEYSISRQGGYGEQFIIIIILIIIMPWLSFNDLSPWISVVQTGLHTSLSPNFILAADLWSDVIIFL